MIRTNRDLLEYVSELEKHALYPIAKETFKSKQQILKQFSRNNKVYVINNGLVKCYLSDENGKEFVQEFLGAGMEFGELEVFNRKTNVCSVTAISEIDVFVLTYAVFKELLKQDAKFNGMIMNALADKICYKAPRHSFQQCYSIQQNIVRIKETFPDVFEVIPKRDIANYMGITQRSLNRVLKEHKL